MPSIQQFRERNRNVSCAMLIFCVFFLSSGIYLSWMYHLAELVSATAVVLYSMVAAYIFQTVGLLLFAFMQKRRSSAVALPSYAAGLGLLLLCSVPAIRSPFQAGVLLFGFLSNLIIGFLAGFYLWALSVRTDKGRRGIVFGGAYAASTVAIWLVSMLNGNQLLRSGYAYLFYLPAALASLAFLQSAPVMSSPKAALPAPDRSLLQLAALTVLLMSLVQNIGFGFSAADLVQGVKLEFSRVLYAVGLASAGLISDRSRKYGAAFALIALILPFIMLSLRGEPISATVFWAMAYLFFGFISVYRILCFTDLSQMLTLPHIAGFGLLFGRIGDALGAGVYILFGKRSIFLVFLASLLFVVTACCFFRFYPKIETSASDGEARARATFERFSSRFDLSPKERGVMRLILEEKSNAEIAQALYVSERTVKFHVHNILSKTGCKNRADLLRVFRDVDRDS